MFSKINKHLSIKFIFWTIIIIIFLQLFNSTILINTKKSEISKDIYTNAQNFARLTTDDIIQYYNKYYKSGYFKFYDLIEETLDLNQDIEEIYIIKADGAIVFHPKELEERQKSKDIEKITNKELLKRVHNIEISIKEFSKNGKQYIDIVNPYIEEWGKHPYSIRFIFNLNTLSNKLNKMKFQIFLISIISIVFGILLIIYLTRTITKSLKTLHTGVKQISSGDLKHDIVINSKDEINELSIEFNKMRESLNENFKKIKDLNQNLEKKVQQRTEELEKLSITDNLTKLYNRNKIDEVLENEINRTKRYNTFFGIIILDVDYFKKVNDTHGHQVGDQVLIELANILKNNSRDVDTIGRWGGEEFLIICAQTDKDGLYNYAQNLRKAIEDYNFTTVKNKTASFGITSFIQNDSPKELLERADKALYQSKQNGRNQVTVK